ncbi:MAG: vanomycin resistance protein VanB [Chloroflexaceae bacterium]|nr:vanomycin resistance protein VanB [Chloroflexaceae bacterium]
MSVTPTPSPWSQDVPTPEAAVEKQKPTAPQSRQSVPWGCWALRILLFPPILIGLLLLYGLYFFDQSFDGLVYPNIDVRGVVIGSMTRDEAIHAIEQHYADFLEQPLVVTYGVYRWKPTLKQLGVTLDIEGAVDEAFTLGRRHADHMDELLEVAAMWQYGHEIPLHMQVDQQAIQGYLQQRVDMVEREAVDAQLLLNGLTVDALPAAMGRQALVSPTVDDITAALATMQPQTVAMRTRQIAPLLDDAVVADAQQQIATLLQGPVILTTTDQGSWEISVEDLAKMVRIQRHEGEYGQPPTIDVSIDSTPIRPYLSEIADLSEITGGYPRMSWNNGNLSITQEGTPGSRIDEVRAEQDIIAAMWTDNREVALHMHDTLPPVHAGNLHELGINELISVGRTDFSGSEAYRVTNIIAGMRLLDGVLIAPGDVFSFNATIGHIGPDNGFVEGYAIVEEKVEVEWGGGICQDATTMFRAAFWAGFPILERMNHTMYLSWYNRYGYGEYGDGPGIDSAIFLGPSGPDLKFVNDTDHWVLIETLADPYNVLAEVRMYGTRGGRSVEFEGPFISHPPDGVLNVDFIRIVKQDGVEVKRETFWSYFTQ